MTKRIPLKKGVPDPTLHLTISPNSQEERILLNIRRHRFLRTRHLTSLEEKLGHEVKRIKCQLHQLNQAGYLTLPKAQYRYEPSKKVSQPDDLVYGLGSKGIKYLYNQGKIASPRMQEKEVREIYLEHTLLISDFMVRLETELPQSINLLYEDSLAPEHVGPLSWRVPILYGGESLKMGVIPDRVFALSMDENLLVFCLEADRGTMPVIRSNPAQTSFYRKVLAYHETWRSGALEKQFGWARFRVLTVTSSGSRCDNLVKMCKEATKGGGSGLFLFADLHRCQSAESILNVDWTLGNGLYPVKFVK